MKAKSLLIAMALSQLAGGAIAQSRDTISLGLMPYHYMGYDNIGPKNLMRQHDGELVSIITVSSPAYLPDPPTWSGTVFYKFSPTSAEITDSLFVAPEMFPYFRYFLDKDPRGEGNVRVNTEPDGEGGTNLRIAHFPDDDFLGDPSEDVVVPLCDVEVDSYTQGFIDSNMDDIIWKYYVRITDSTWEGHIARFGLDGTRKHDAVIPEDSISSSSIGVFCKHPKTYYQWNWEWDGTGSLSFRVYDSLFQQKNSYLISKNFLPGESYVYFEFNNNSFDFHTFVIPYGDNEIVVAAPYSDFSLDPNGGWPVYDSVQRGVALARYELRTMQQKGLVMFNDYPGPNTWTIPMCLFRSSDGCLYFVYRETVWLDNGMEDPTPITAVKMNPNLNVLWKRYINMPKGYQMQYVNCQVAEEEEGSVKIAVIGCNNYVAPYVYMPGLLYFIFSEEETNVGVNGSGIVMRPYCFYPNPVHGQLCMQFSPDVQPRQVELYDVQGRLVHTQRSSFGSVDMSLLPAGTYMMRVILENGKTYSDKVVKE